MLCEQSRNSGLLLAAGFEFLQLGWSAVPLRPADAMPPGNPNPEVDLPLGESTLWQLDDYQKRLPREAELRLLWNRARQMNIGIATGRVSGLLVVIVDGPGGEKLLRQLSSGDMQDTVEFAAVLGARRLIYTLPPDVVFTSKRVVGPNGNGGLRILANGSWSLMPPSIEPPDGCYTWRAGHSHKVRRPAPAPSWLVALLSTPPCCIEASLNSSANTSSSLTAAGEFLRILLSAGAKPADECLRKARRAGFSERTVRRAKIRVHVRSSRESRAPTAPWLWRLAEPTEIDVAAS